MEKERARAAAGIDAAMEGEAFDPVPEITARHFEMAMRDARRSVSDMDLARYASFATSLQQSRAAISAATGQSIAGFAFPRRDGAPAAGGGGGGGGGAAPAEDDLCAFCAAAGRRARARRRAPPSDPLAPPPPPTHSAITDS